MSLINIDITSYDNFRRDALNRASQGLGYDVDGYYGYQCWDLTAELWMHVPEFTNSGLYPHTGPQHYASECWTYSKDVNAGSSFDLIYYITELKRGDIIVIDRSAISETGHIAFCDQDYQGTNYLELLGQNQVNPSAVYGHIPTVTRLNISSFLGAFRYKEWKTTPPTPPIPLGRRNKFPWVLYARKLREQR